MKKHIVLILAGFICVGASLLYAQRVVESNELKVSPAKYRHSTITIKDVFTNPVAGIPPSLTASGYTSQRYITFGIKNAGMRCFMRRSSANEKLVAGLQEGARITLVGTVKQPKAKIEKAEGRITDKYKLDIYVLEVQRITPGWGSK